MPGYDPLRRPGSGRFCVLRSVFRRSGTSQMQIAPMTATEPPRH